MPTPLRILHLTPNLSSERFGSGGGGEWMAAHLLTHLDRDRFAPAIASLFDRTAEAEIEPLLETEGIEVVGLGKQLGPDVRIFKRVYDALRRFRPDVVHTHRYVLRYAFPALLAYRPAAHVHTVHSIAEKEVERPMRVLHRWMMRRGMVPVAVATEVAESLGRVYGLEAPLLIPNGIPLDRFRPSPGRRAAWRHDHGFGADDVLVACVARLTPVKNHALLLDAFGSAVADGAPGTLLLAGPGELRADLEARARALGLGDRVRFLGPRDDVADLLAASDLFALASEWEGNPLSVLEAMAAGNPVVATRVGGLPELVAEGETGLLVPSGDADAFADALGRVLCDAETRARMGAASRRRALDRFSATEMARAYGDLYERAFRNDIPEGAR